jgi:hypothetical protein
MPDGWFTLFHPALHSPVLAFELWQFAGRPIDTGQLLRPAGSRLDSEADLFIDDLIPD